MVDSDRILLVDLSSVFWRFYAVSGAEDASFATRRTVARIRGFARDFSRVAVCADLRAKTWRHELAASYKANREAKPEDAYAQLRATMAELAADGFPVWSAQGFEADDVIASAVAVARSRDLDVTIVSADKDLLQLVDEHVFVLSTSQEEKTDAKDGDPPTRRIAKTWKPEDVVEAYGVAPALLVDWLAMVGDVADNVKGFPGIGPKNATGALVRFGSLEGTIAAARAEEAVMLWELKMSNGEAIEEIGPKPEIPNPPIKPAAKKSILENADQARLARKLIALRTDVPIPFDEVLRERAQRPDDAQPIGFDASPDDELAIEQVATPEPAKVDPPKVAEPIEAKEEEPEEKVEPVEFGKSAPSSAIVQHVEWSHSLEPRSLRDAWNVSRTLADSRMFGHLNNAQGIFAAALLARSHGVETMKLLMPGMLHNIEGKIAMSAQLIVGLVLRSGKAEYFDLVSSSATKAVYVTKRVGGRREVEFEYTIEEAQAAGLLRPTRTGAPSQYVKRPKTMLRHRCETELSRAVYPDVVGGLYTADELGEVDSQEAA